jgi:hypothetical protein
MKRNIVILLCLVFFTQSAFADWEFWCDDCERERNAYRRERDTCYNYNADWQKLHKNESARIEEVETQRDTCIQEKDSLKNKATWLLSGISFALAGCVGYIFWLKHQLAARGAPIHNVGNGVVNIVQNIQN